MQFGDQGGPPLAPKAWARVRLVRGESEGEVWDVTGETAGVRLDVGSASSCTWCVRAPGVTPHQLVFFWDGEVLWSSDLHASGKVRVDGEPLLDWRALTGTVTIEFGQAVMVVETSASAVFDRATDRGYGPTGPYETREAPAARLPAQDEPPTRVLHTGAGPPPSSESRVLDLPTFPASLDPQVGSGDPNATRVLDANALGLDAIGSAAPLPQAGLGAHRVDEAPAPASEPPGLPSSEPPEIDAWPPPPSEEASVPASDPWPPEPAGAPSGSEATGPGAAESGSGSGSAAARPRFAPPPPPGHVARTKERVRASFSRRTRILLMVTVMTAALTLLLRRDPPPAPKAGERSPAPSAAATGEGLEDAGTSGDDETSGGEPAFALADAHEEEGEGDDGDAKTPEGRAAAALLSGRHKTALRRYQELADRYPGRPEFSVITKILRRRVADQCTDGVDSFGRPCGTPGGAP